MLEPLVFGFDLLGFAAVTVVALVALLHVGEFIERSGREHRR